MTQQLRKVWEGLLLRTRVIRFCFARIQNPLLSPNFQYSLQNLKNKNKKPGIFVEIREMS